jgi:hypothetical protein
MLAMNMEGGTDTDSTDRARDRRVAEPGKSAPNGRLKQINAAGAASSIGLPDTCSMAENGSILPINARAAGERDARAVVLPAERRENPWMISAVDGAVIAALH